MQDTVISQYLDGRVVSLTITAEPVNEVSSRQGSWTISFQPYFNINDTNRDGFTGNWLPTENSMMHQYACVTGSASRKLVLTYTPRVHDGNAFMFQNLDSVYGEVCIRYSDPNRNDYSSFKSSDFNCRVALSGRVELRTSPFMPPSNSGGYTFTTAIDDRLAQVGMFLWSPKPKNTIGTDVFGYINSEGFLCKETEKTCKVSGTISLPPLNYEMDFERLDL